MLNLSESDHGNVVVKCGPRDLLRSPQMSGILVDSVFCRLCEHFYRFLFSLHFSCRGGLRNESSDILNAAERIIIVQEFMAGVMKPSDRVNFLELG